MEATLDIADLAATESFGRALAERLFPGAVIALVGTLGAGKTHLVRAVAEGLGANPAAVSSPTFVLIQEYAGRLPIFHFDAYRLGTVREFADLGANEYFESNGVCLVEWADKVEPVLPADHLRIEIEVLEGTRRRFMLSARGRRSQEMLAGLISGFASSARPGSSPVRESTDAAG